MKIFVLALTVVVGILVWKLASVVGLTEALLFVAVMSLAALVGVVIGDIIFEMRVKKVGQLVWRAVQSGRVKALPLPSGLCVIPGEKEAVIVSPGGDTIYVYPDHKDRIPAEDVEVIEKLLED